MSELYLYHYYEAEHGPFRSLSGLSEEEAERVMRELKRQGAAFAGKRPDDYMTVRRQLEQKARDLFIRKGGQPAKPYPHYMTLGECDWIRQWYVDGRQLQVRLDEVDPLAISFTYGDLFPTMRYADSKPYRQQVYVKREMMELIGQYGWPQRWNADGANGPERYIEAQIWDDRILDLLVSSRVCGGDGQTLDERERA